MTLSPTWNVTCPPQQQQVSRKGERTLSSPFSIQNVRREGKETGLKSALFSSGRAALRHVPFGADFLRDQLLRVSVNIEMTCGQMPELVRPHRSERAPGQQFH